MEISLSLQFSCKTVFPNRSTCFNRTPSSWCKPSTKLSCVNASSDFSRKRQQKKGSVAKSKGSSPKGFVPKSSIGSSSKKNARVKKGEQTLDVNVDDDKDGEVEFSLEEKHAIVDKTNEIAREFGQTSLSDETLDVVETNRGEEDVDDDLLHGEGTSYIGDDGYVKDSEEANAATDDRINEEASRMLKLKLEENLRKQKIERIADENFLRGKQMFVYPPVVKPDQDIVVFLNKNLSTLRDEEDILILGAFNDWRWKSFTIRLNKTDLKDNWWSCQLYVPIEAYKLDFVFFNGQSVYDNNDQKDFCITVDGGMDALAFEEFLLEEKRKELEKLAKEQAERERHAEEERRIEADKAAKEEDRLQARLEVERRQETVLQLMKNAVKSNDSVWYIEPSEFKGKDLVRLYYNGSSGPLEHAKEIWIHGGYNNWKDGLSIVERLVKSGLKGGAWWYADVVVPDQALVLDWVFADGPPQLDYIHQEVELKCLNFHFKFEKGKLEIEQLHITKTTKAKWCNLIAWEHLQSNLRSTTRRGSGNCKFTSAALIFNGLICSEDDVQLLKNKKIVVDHLKMSNRELVEYFRKVALGVDHKVVAYSIYTEMVRCINNSEAFFIKQMWIMVWNSFTCRQEWVVRFLNRNYNFVATVVSVLAVVQTVYTVLPYYFPK